MGNQLTGLDAMLAAIRVGLGANWADWPGLAPAQLYEVRDSKPTMGLDALIGGAVAAHFALDPALAVPRLFPGSTGAAVGGLIRG